MNISIYEYITNQTTTMSLNGGLGIENTTIVNPSTDPVQTEPNIQDDTLLETMGLGMELRSRQANYPQVRRVASVYNQCDTNGANITTTERSFGMPAGSNEDVYVRPTTASAFQVSSTSVNDTSAGTGAQTISITGLTNIGGVWSEISETLTMNGQTPVATTSTDWWRVNKIFVSTSGSLQQNDGEIYVYPTGQSTTAGNPDANAIQAVITGFSNSSGGCFSIGSNRKFDYTFGNFWLDETKAIVIREFFYQDFSGGDDLTRYEVGTYPSQSVSYNYNGAASYTEKTDICLNISTTTGTATHATYYVEYIETDTTLNNN